MYRRLEEMIGWSGPSGRRDLSRIAIVGNALPRQCGLATYTSHVFDALRSRFPALAVDFHAMNDPGRDYDYPDTVTGTIRQEEIGDYLRAADRIEARGAELVWIQHEFGIFGGPAGEYLLKLVERLSIPVAVTLHTVLAAPNAAQRGVMERLIRASSRLIVMAEKGRAILKSRYGVPDRKIMVIPHGVPDRPCVDPDFAKPAFGLSGRKVLLTFGLLSPNKGIETMIRAMPAILDAHPDTIYMIVGATHPHLLAREGERYRASLEALAEKLGVARQLRWVDAFLDQEDLLDLLAAADLYVTPYLNLEQITSGTLSYAVALGKPVISTPYHHAAEIIGAENGRLIEPGDAAGFADSVTSLLGNGPLRRAMAENAWRLGRSMIWRRHVEASLAGFAALEAPLIGAPAASPGVRPEPVGPFDSFAA